MRFVLRMNTVSAMTNAFCAGMNTLALETNMLKMGVRGSATHTQTHTHTASYHTQRLSNKIHVEMTAIVTPTYFRNGRYHVEEIQKVSKCKIAPSVALDWSSRQSKQWSRKITTIGVAQLLIL